MVNSPQANRFARSRHAAIQRARCCTTGGTRHEQPHHAPISSGCVWRCLPHVRPKSTTITPARRRCFVVLPRFVICRPNYEKITKRLTCGFVKLEKIKTEIRNASQGCDLHKCVKIWLRFIVSRLFRANLLKERHRDTSQTHVYVGAPHGQRRCLLCAASHIAGPLFRSFASFRNLPTKLRKNYETCDLRFLGTTKK